VVREKGKRGPYRPKGAGWERGDRKLKASDVGRVIEALRRAHGVKRAAARLLHVSAPVLYAYIREHRDEVEEALHQITEELVDQVESALIKGALKREDFRCMQLILTTKGASRGWNARLEVTGPGGGALVSAGPSAADLIQALEAVLARRQEQPALAAPEGVPLLELSAEPAAAESGPGADPASDPTEDAG
jgi:hypothetical protein